MDRDTSVGSVTRMQRQTENWIKESLLELLKIYDFDEITIKQIAATAEISRPTFYRHYSTKDEVLEDLINDIITEYAELMRKSFPESFDETLGLCFNYFESKQDIMKVLIRAHLSNYFTSAFISKFITLINDFPASWRSWDNDLQISLGVQFVTGGIINVLIGWIATDCKINSEIIVRELISTIQNLVDK